MVKVDSQTAGWLVLSDIWYPGWRASVDGSSAPVTRADYLFRAVRVDAGEHLITFNYVPVWFYAGCLISLVSWIGLAFLASKTGKEKSGYDSNAIRPGEVRYP